MLTQTTRISNSLWERTGKGEGGGGGEGGSLAKSPDTDESNNSNFKLTLGSTGKVGGELVSV